ncbi:MFS transporter [Aciduricibacillus chroicocephali]|uniref:MFS transporter n=1 Tax=Aciduricibacillus chroicocephali TaxID=3054939 RepID=A0ABY9KUF1_9BACI|nr:MFS transporter [Bacillaceae bacterium 44XB]
MNTSRERSQQQRPKIWTRDFVLICLTNMFLFMGFQMTLPTLPLLVEDLGGSDQLIGFVIGIFTLSALVLRPIAGHALESRGRGIVYMIGLFIFVISVGSYAFIGSIFFLFAMRIVQGVGWGMSTTASGTIATDLIPPSRRGEGMGYFGLSGNLALAFGPSLGLFLAGTTTFKVLFLACGALGLMAFILSTQIHYKKVEKQEERATTVGLDIFEKTALKPAILMFFITATFGGIASFLPLYAQQKHIEGIEFYFFIYALFLLISRLFAGKIYDKRGHLYIYLPGAALITAAMILLSWLPSTTVMLVAAALYGLGFGSVQPALQAWSVEKAAPNRKGMANATLFSFFDLGVGVGAMIFGQLAGWFGYGSIYIAAAGSVAFSMIVYLFFFMSDRKATQKSA